ncbi:entericidin A [Silvimonas terrae]|uniref:Entericidin A n=1 Tax=Silvimonas terrae TaxID=300266 RepID=A0A840RDA7_9NEIS|nr:entericidin A/B family lipoprotein [Silvimonas terrae]MBB5190292.1 entericidin A [Silvimonas terrae]
MKTLFASLLMLSLLLLAGCNTVHGFGEDVQKVGEKIQGK